MSEDGALCKVLQTYARENSFGYLTVTVEQLFRSRLGKWKTLSSSESSWGVMSPQTLVSVRVQAVADKCGGWVGCTEERRALREAF